MLPPAARHRIARFDRDEIAEQTRNQAHFPFLAGPNLGARCTLKRRGAFSPRRSGLSHCIKSGTGTRQHGEYQAIFTDLLADPSVLVPFILIGIRR